MVLAMLIVRFLGSWLLFAGAIYQAAIELRDEDIEFDRIKAVTSQVEKPQRISIWWWLLPPLKVYLERRSKHEYRDRYIKALPKKDIEAIVSFRSKANGWQLVYLGSLLLAIDETYELVKHENWSYISLAALVILMILVSLLNLIMSLKHADKIKQL